MSPHAAHPTADRADGGCIMTSHPFARRSLSEPGPLEAAAARGGQDERTANNGAAPSSSSSRCPFAAAAAAGPSPSAPSAAPWHARLRRPALDGDAARLSRRALRAQNRSFSLEEVKEHRFADDGWICYRGRVFDITEHVVRHKGWDTGCGMTEVLSILAHLGTDCTAEFDEIHACYPVAFAQLRAYDIGALRTSEEEADRGGGGA